MQLSLSTLIPLAALAAPALAQCANFRCPARSAAAHGQGTYPLSSSGMGTTFRQCRYGAGGLPSNSLIICEYSPVTGRKYGGTSGLSGDAYDFCPMNAASC